MNSIEQLWASFKRRNVAEQIIGLNLLLFILLYLFNSFAFVMGLEENYLLYYLSLKADLDLLIFQPWTLITYGFVHEGFLHILFNMILLYYFGQLFLDFFDRGSFIRYYLIGILMGGLIYLIAYNFFPGLKTTQSLLIGASAGVTAIVIGIASHIPNYAMHFRFIGSIKLLYIAIVLVLWDLIQIPNGNAGGHLAHLGGALAGFMLTRMGTGKGFSIDFGSFGKTRRSKQPFQKVYKNKQQNSPGSKTATDQEKIDAILDKISKSGYDTLTKEEKEFLFNAGKK